MYSSAPDETDTRSRPVRQPVGAKKSRVDGSGDRLDGPTAGGDRLIASKLAVGNRKRLSRPHVKLICELAFRRSIGDPPPSGHFCSAVSVKYATHCSSGEITGSFASSGAPAIGLASTSPGDRTNRLPGNGRRTR